MGCRTIRGPMEGHEANVDDEGSLQVVLAPSMPPVETEPLVASGVVTSLVTVGTTSGDLVSATADRRQFDIQNTDATNAIHILLGAGTATLAHRIIRPGESYAGPPGVAYTGVIVAIAEASATVVVQEFEK